MLSRDTKRRLKSILIDALANKLPMTLHLGNGGYYIEAASTRGVGDSFLQLKVRDAQGNLETYLEVSVHERF